MASFYPGNRFISAVTKSFPAVMTFTEDHNFTSGEILSFRVPKDFGMFELNNKQAKVLSITSDSVTLDIETNNFTAFVYAGADNEVTEPAMAIASSSGVIPNERFEETNLLDAFDHRPSS